MANSDCNSKGHAIPRPVSRQSGIIGLLLLLVGAFFSSSANSDELRSKKITAGFVFNFAKFIEWPDLPPAAPIQLCVYADREMLNIFAELSGHRIAGHEVKIVAFSTKELNNCQVLYIDRSRQNIFQCADIKHHARLLSVSNIDNFVRQCGMIGLFEVDNKLRFTINLDAVKRSELKMSSHLLRLAHIWRGKKQ